jgi:hypothetical protein
MAKYGCYPLGQFEDKLKSLLAWNGGSDLLSIPTEELLYRINKAGLIGYYLSGGYTEREEDLYI